MNNMYSLIICLVAVIFFSGCQTMPPPVAQDLYEPIAGAPSVAIKVNDQREDDVVGKVGLATFKMDELDAFLYKNLRNDLNQIASFNVQSFIDKDSLMQQRLPFALELDLVSISFVSMDALMDDADGSCLVRLKLYAADGRLALSKDYNSSLKRKVAWPNMNGNTVIVEELLRRVSRKIVEDEEVRSILSY